MPPHLTSPQGQQASNAADYAFGQFRFLKDLLLVHGHWCYHRICKLILYSFYKNATLAFIPFWFVFVNGFSGQVWSPWVARLLLIALSQSFVEKWTVSLYNVVYTALPILAIGIFDQVLTREHLFAYPVSEGVGFSRLRAHQYCSQRLYESGIRKRFFNVPVFIGWMTSAVFHSLMAFFFVSAAVSLLACVVHIIPLRL